MTKLLRPTPIVAGPQVGAAALGRFMTSRSAYGRLAAPIKPATRVGLARTPALGGLFRRGQTKGVSTINAMATHVWRG